MGLSWSARRRYNYQPPSQLISSSSSTSVAAAASEPNTSSNPPILSPPPPPTPPPPPPPPPPNYVFAANAPYPAHSYPPQNPYHTLPPPPPPPPPHLSFYHYCGYNPGGYSGPSNYTPYYDNHVNGWHGIRPPGAPMPPPPPPPYVDHQSAKKIRNDVNVHKDTIKVEVDQMNPDCHLVSFTFDSLVDGSITIFYFAKEGANCSFSALYPEAHMHVRVPFQKGLGQKFRQPPGTGIDLGFFELDDLAKPSPNEDTFPLVISAEACLPHQDTDEHLTQPLPLITSPHAQITQAVLEKNNRGCFQVRVIRQILWVDGVRYELRELYGIGNSAQAGFDDNDPGKECVICMTEPKDTAILPCRHMCMCSECAKALRLQSNKCPICRQPIEELIEIKVNKDEQ
ncbi:PREDICTED: probable E3 ubiquitin-protein ligase LUL4 [Nelumbo nucifera]|uniref:RING-type E3 ubiquitin transferase n=1 Tax=Nelumbo nucifera TaxID=4432 RepID=A0A1U7ZR30_NELNU|nr:PREDICTED: probable E3 ubiquitin-protein ligase LUL4 [Nelumbo nucifera]